MICAKTLKSSKQNWLSDIAEMAIQKSDTIGISISVDKVVLADVIERWCEEIKKVEAAMGNDMLVSPFRVAGFLTFWLRKLKPFKIDEYKKGHPKKQLFVNEILSIVLGISIVYGALKDKKGITADAFERFLTSLRYNAMSPYAIALIYEYLYQGCKNN